MTTVAVIGASGQIARQAIPLLAAAGAELTLFARDSSRVDAPPGARVVEGDALDLPAVAEAVRGQDVVYANLAGPIADEAAVLVQAMDAVGARRLIFIVSLGIYHELPEPFETWNDRMIGDALTDYRRAADIIEDSGLDYTIVRPAWLTDEDDTSYDVTEKGETFRGTEVARKAVASFVVDVAMHPEKHSRGNVGLGKPGTDGDKPAFM